MFPGMLSRGIVLVTLVKFALGHAGRIQSCFEILPVTHVCSAIWHPSMWGYNVTTEMFPYDNRPVVPLQNMPFDQWWFVSTCQCTCSRTSELTNLCSTTTSATHLIQKTSWNSLPVNPLSCKYPATKDIQTIMLLPRGVFRRDSVYNLSYLPSASRGDIRDPNSDHTCPGQPTTAIHANNQQDVAGCAIAIAYKSNVNDVKPEDFVIFTVNWMCPWYLKTTFQVPIGMPACPDGGCICAWFWIHNVSCRHPFSERRCSLVMSAGQRL